MLKNKKGAWSWNFTIFWNRLLKISEIINCPIKNLKEAFSNGREKKVDSQICFLRHKEPVSLNIYLQVKE